MSAQVFCFASAKGGSGKTILTATFASFLTALGKKCLILDSDAATHGMTLLYIVEVSAHVNENRLGVFDLYEVSDNTSGRYGDTFIEQNLTTVGNGVDLLPATYKFKTGYDPENTFEGEFLSSIIRGARDDYDFIFLDAQAGTDKCARWAMNSTISDRVVIVSEYDPLSSAGIERLKQALGDDLGYARTWTLLNKMLPEFVDKFTEFLSVTKYLPPIPWNANVVRAYAKRSLPLDLEGGNEFTLAIMRVANVLFGEEIEEDVQAWSKGRAYALKAPLEEQYRDAEYELAQALEEKNHFEIRRRRRSILSVYAVVVVASGAAAAGVWILSVTAARFGGGWVVDDVLGLGVAILIIPAALLGVIGAFRRERTAEGARYERVIAALEERLRRLEVLRNADYEAMVRERESRGVR